MAVSYATPGVYVEVIDKGTKPIEGVGTSVTAFVGVTADATRKTISRYNGELVPTEPVGGAELITNWTQYTNVFGGFADGAFLPDAVYGYFMNGGGPCFVTSVRSMTASAEVPTAGSSKVNAFRVSSKISGEMGDAISVTIKAGGSAPASASSAAAKDDDKKPAASKSKTAASKQTGPPTFSITIGNQTEENLSMDPNALNFVGNVIFEQAVLSHFGPMDSMPKDGTYSLSGGKLSDITQDEYIGSAADRTGINGLEAVDEISLVICPDVMAGYDEDDQNSVDKVAAVQNAMIAHCQNMQYRFAILDAPPNMSPQKVLDWRMNTMNFDSSYAALYYPWVRVPDMVSGVGTRLVPPSGYVVGIYNRSDAERGVHKAPANEVLLGVSDLELNITKGEQDLLNPRGVNCIRAFPGRGIRVWGARTLSSDGSWRYINVRRLFNFVGKSLEAGLQWVVFEPNDTNLWGKVSRDINAFMRVVWRSGALFGTSPDKAFFVKVDEELNPPEIRDLGQLIIEIGMAPVKPAEFVILRMSQWVGADAEE